ncbi:MAG: SIMPL domain-containing protein [Methylacidiphilales bacterium]|nr:SIMPL domain-containing protein [Candidatus Methylacidiphilales bacterium]
MTTPSSPCPRSLLFPAGILALSLAFGAVVLAGPLRDFVKSRQTITVKGYAEQDLASDFALWSATVTTRGKQVNVAADEMDKDTHAVTDFLIAQGIPKENILVSDLTTTALSKSTDGVDGGLADLDGYKLDRRFQVTSTDVDSISKLTGSAPVLLRNGVEVSFNPTEYYCTKLADLKVTMLGEAVMDAQRRAEQIASKSGRKIGGLRSANQGVFQITAVYETETSEEGSLDTGSREKSIKAVVTAEFELL